MAGKASFNWIDPLLLDQQLTEEERMVQASAAQFAADKLAPRVLEAFRHERTDPAIFREMGETGLLGATIPEAYGGSGLNYVCYGLIAREVERIDSLPLDDERAVLAGDGADLRVRQRGDQAEVPARPAANTSAASASPSRTTAPTLARWSPGRKGRRRLSPVRQQDVDHQQPDRRCLRGLGQDDAGEIRGFVLERAGKGCPPRRFTEKSACAPRSPARSSWTTCSARKRTPSPTCAG